MLIKNISKHFTVKIEFKTINLIWIMYQLGTKLEISILFSMISPYIWPITALAMYSNIIVYSWISNDNTNENNINTIDFIQCADKIILEYS